MLTEDEWILIRAFKGMRSGASGIGVLRLAILFGGVAIAAALLLTPAMERRVSGLVATYGDLDRMTTGSVGASRGTTYTIRRSVLQGSPDAVCIIGADGGKSGSCN